MTKKVKEKPEKLGVEELKNQLSRALADYDNLRKRTELEKEVWLKFATERLLIKLLTVLDMFESAQAHLKDQGLGIAISEFKKVFNEEGLEEIRPSQGETFDPTFFEAVESLEGGEKDKVAELVLVGWKFKDGSVIRHAKVKVYGGLVDKKKEESGKETV